MRKIVQFKAMVKSKATGIINNIKSGRRTAVLSMFSVFFALSLVISFVFSGTRVVYRVKYSGKNIAIVDKKESFDNAKKTVVKLVQGENVEAAVATPEYTATIAPTFAINNQSEIVDAIIDNTDEIVAGSVLYVDGQNTLCAPSELLSKCMKAQLNNFNIEGEICNSYFLENIKIEDGYFLKSDFCEENRIIESLSELTVVTEVNFITDITVPYKTVENPDNTMMVGMEKVVTPGVDGINRVVKQNTYINGVLTSEILHEEEVVSEPIDEVVNIGSVLPDLSKYAIEYTGSGLVFPVSSKNWAVSAYFGDNRGHKGIDLSAPTGEPILAAQSGTVTLSQWYYGYGNCVIIDHGNGFTTLYGHASHLLVKSGQHVNAGDVIALVGSTGDSTGSHLHFEISINGNRIDPAYYLGLN